MDSRRNPVRKHKRTAQSEVHRPEITYELNVTLRSDSRANKGISGIRNNKTQKRFGHLSVFPGIYNIPTTRLIYDALWKQSTKKKKHVKASSATRMHSSRMRTVRSSGRPGGSPPGTPRDQASPGADPLPRTRHPPRADPLPRTRHPPPVDRITYACKNFTLPQLRCGR